MHEAFLFRFKIRYFILFNVDCIVSQVLELLRDFFRFHHPMNLLQQCTVSHKENQKVANDTNVEKNHLTHIIIYVYNVNWFRLLVKINPKNLIQRGVDL